MQKDALVAITHCKHNFFSRSCSKSVLHGKYCCCHIIDTFKFKFCPFYLYDSNLVLIYISVCEYLHFENYDCYIFYKELLISLRYNGWTAKSEAIH